MTDPAVADTRRLNSKPQDLTDAYGPPSNYLEIDVSDPQTVGVGRNRYTNYEVRMRTNLPIFKLKESCVRRRYSDFEWLKIELERDSKIVVPSLPGKALKRQLPFRGDGGLFDESFIEERRSGLEQFINRIAGHPLAQNERCLHMFLQDEGIDRHYIPGKWKAPPPSCVSLLHPAPRGGSKARTRSTERDISSASTLTALFTAITQKTLKVLICCCKTP
ncbi:sorting nexin-12-like isoform X1 [Anarhichas minor]|uniref:sorting nexin-12-like isoform X1 n=1 Tax=Anarhichas minor TaxID=65739 RepID=UPI003F732842